MSAPLRVVVRSATATLLAICLLAPSAFAQSPAAPRQNETVTRDDAGHVTVRAVRVTEAPRLDGRLDEAIYADVPPISDFIQQDPHEGEPATEKTEAWVFFDDRNVYVALRCWLQDPRILVANEMRRDDINIWWNDNVGVSLDTFHDGRSGVFFQTNALGGVREGASSDERNINYDYNTVWDVKSQLFDGGWTTEMAIPFKSLRYAPGREQVWGLILQRVIRGKNELSYLTRMPASYGGQALFKYSSAATLVGIEAPTGTRNLDIKPYAISDLTTNRLTRPAISNDPGASVGADAKYGVTKGLTLDVTYNTDFAQIEADDTQVNLTRFNLFYPEKREFFLEGQTIFAFGGANAQAQGGGPGEVPLLFFSRRIGLDSGQTVPIRAGARLTGRAGRYTLGLMNLQTGAAGSDATTTPSTNFSVVRLKRDILRRSNVGAIATARAPSAGSRNLVAGADAALQFFQNVQINSYYARTHTTGVSGDAASYRGQFKYSADRYGVEVDHLKVGAAFDPEVGFLKRRDFRRNYAQLRFSPRPRSLPGIRKIGWEANLDDIARGDGGLQTRQVLGTFRVALDNGDNFDANYSRNAEALLQPFRIASNVTLAPGEYHFDESRLNYQLGPQRRATGTLTLARGSFYDGNKIEIGYAGRIGINRRLVLEPRLSVNKVSLPAGSFTAKVIGNRTTVAFTPRMFVAALLQYNSGTRTFGSNVRFRWEYTPGSDLFFVYSEGRDTLQPGWPELQNRALVVKYTRLFRF